MYSVQISVFKHLCFSERPTPYTYFQWTEDGQGFQIQYLTLEIARHTSGQSSRYRQVLDFGFENLAYLQSAENKCDQTKLVISGNHLSSSSFTPVLV